jgi:hypothetical protein
MKEETPYIIIEDLEGGKFSIYDVVTLEVASLDGTPQEGLDEQDADEVLIALEGQGRRHLRLVSKDDDSLG